MADPSDQSNSTGGNNGGDDDDRINGLIRDLKRTIGREKVFRKYYRDTVLSNKPKPNLRLTPS